ncbi:MAG: hypothetical protein WB729_06685 [Candidatus Sulfotelmatobacter sp.]
MADVKHFTLEEIISCVTPERAQEWLAGQGTLTGDPQMEQFLFDSQKDQDIWDSTVLCAFESTTGLEGVSENPDAFEAWLNTPAAEPALAALESARAGVWISPPHYQDAVAFWQTVAKAKV